MGHGPGPGTGLTEDMSQRGAFQADSGTELSVRVPSCLLQPRVFVRSTDLSLVACGCSSDSGAQPCSQDT